MSRQWRGKYGYEEVEYGKTDKNENTKIYEMKNKGKTGTTKELTSEKAEKKEENILGEGVVDKMKRKDSRKRQRRRRWEMEGKDLINTVLTKLCKTVMLTGYCNKCQVAPTKNRTLSKQTKVLAMYTATKQQNATEVPSDNCKVMAVCDCLGKARERLYAYRDLYQRLKLNCSKP
jgi:hypothetical protein